MYRPILLSIGLLCAASSGHAATELIHCKLDKLANAKGWIQAEMVIFSADGKTQVLDGLIAHYNDEKPLDAQILEDSDTRTTYGWRLPHVRNASQTVEMQYRATYFKKNSKITVRALPGGYANQFRATGRCERTVR